MPLLCLIPPHRALQAHDPQHLDLAQIEHVTGLHGDPSPVDGRVANHGRGRRRVYIARAHARGPERVARIIDPDSECPGTVEAAVGPPCEADCGYGVGVCAEVHAEPPLRPVRRLRTRGDGRIRSGVPVDSPDRRSVCTVRRVLRRPLRGYLHDRHARTGRARLAAVHSVDTERAGVGRDEEEEEDEDEDGDDEEDKDEEEEEEEDAKEEEEENDEEEADDVDDCIDTNA